MPDPISPIEEAFPRLGAPTECVVQASNGSRLGFHGWRLAASEVRDEAKPSLVRPLLAIYVTTSAALIALWSERDPFTCQWQTSYARFATSRAFLEWLFVDDDLDVQGKVTRTVVWREAAERWPALNVRLSED